MNSIKSILAANGQNAESMEIGESVIVDPDSQTLMPLVIEKIDHTELCVGHYHKQAGDLMSDPEIHFELRESNWIPIRYIQDPGIECEDQTGLDLEGFLEIWNQNLQRQGFVSTADE